MGLGIAVLGSNINQKKLDRIRLIRNRWIEKKVSQIPLDQPSALVEVAPQG